MEKYNECGKVLSIITKVLNSGCFATSKFNNGEIVINVAQQEQVQKGEHKSRCSW
jgi:hypothetical protein